MSPSFSDTWCKLWPRDARSGQTTTPRRGRCGPGCGGAACRCRPDVQRTTALNHVSVSSPVEASTFAKSCGDTRTHIDICRAHFPTPRAQFLVRLRHLRRELTNPCSSALGGSMLDLFCSVSRARKSSPVRSPSMWEVGLPCVVVQVRRGGQVRYRPFEIDRFCRVSPRPGHASFLGSVASHGRGREPTRNGAEVRALICRQAWRCLDLDMSGWDLRHWLHGLFHVGAEASGRVLGDAAVVGEAISENLRATRVARSLRFSGEEAQSAPKTTQVQRQILVHEIVLQVGVPVSGLSLA